MDINENISFPSISVSFMTCINKVQKHAQAKTIMPEIKSQVLITCKVLKKMYYKLQCSTCFHLSTFIYNHKYVLIYTICMPMTCPLTGMHIWQWKRLGCGLSGCFCRPHIRGEVTVGLDSESVAVGGYVTALSDVVNGLCGVCMNIKGISQTFKLHVSCLKSNTCN